MPEGSSLVLSGRVIAVRLKRPVSRRDLAINPPLLPPACKKMLDAVRWCYRCMVTYADDGNVLDVVVGRHAGGLVMDNLSRCCKLTLCCNCVVKLLQDGGERLDGSTYV